MSNWIGGGLIVCFVAYMVIELRWAIPSRREHMAMLQVYLAEILKEEQ